LQEDYIKKWYDYEKPLDNHPLQKEIFEDSTKHKVVVAGRGFGKSIVGMWFTLKNAYYIPNCVAWIVCPEHKSVNEIFWYDLLHMIETLNWKCEPKKQGDYFLLKNRHGGYSYIYFKSVKEGHLRGRSINSLYIDEAQDCFTIKPRFWSSDLAPALDRGHGTLLVCGTPKGKGKFYELYQLGKNNPRWKSWTFKSIDNPTDVEFIKHVQERRKELSPIEFRQEYEASFETYEGLAYNLFNREIHLRPLQLDYNLPLCLAFDFNHPLQTTSICQIVDGNSDKEQDRVVNLIKCINTRNSWIVNHMNSVLRWLNSINWKNKIYLYGDFTGGYSDSAAEADEWSIIKNMLREHGYSCEAKYKVSPVEQKRVNAFLSKLLNADNEVGLYFNSNKNEYGICETEPMIKDMEEVEIDEKTGKIKKNDIMLTHNSDNLGYLIYQEFSQKKKTPFMSVISW
jgi:hypothetical protein